MKPSRRLFAAGALVLAAAPFVCRRLMPESHDSPPRTTNSTAFQERKKRLRPGEPANPPPASRRPFHSSDGHTPANAGTEVSLTKADATETPLAASASGLPAGSSAESAPAVFSRRPFQKTRPRPETVTEEPQFRVTPPRAPQAGELPGPVNLEFSEAQQLPAILAADSAPSSSSVPGNAPTLQQQLEAGIAGEFISAVTTGQADPEKTSASGGDRLSEEQRWDQAQREADEQYEVLVGQEVYLRKSLEAALLKRQASQPVP